MNPILQICNIFCKNKKTKFAIKFLEELSDVLIDSQQGFILGLCFQELGEYEKAISIFEKLKDYVQDKDQVAANLAICHTNLLQIKEAYEYLELCHKFDLRIQVKQNIDRVSREMAYLRSDSGFWQNHDEHIHSYALSDFIVKTISKDRPVHDFGCGDGFYLSVLESAGFGNLTGYEGSPTAQPKFKNIQSQDLATSFDVSNKGHVICLEVAEHVPRKYEQVFLNNITNACDGYLIFSWAIRGQGGTCHVNCRNNDEVMDMIIEKGFRYDHELTQLARSVIENHCGWFQDTLLIFYTERANSSLD